MTNTNYQQFAKDFIDLWQKQIANVASDKQFIQTMLEMMQSMSTQGYDAKTNAPSSHAADAPDAEPRVLAELAFRLGACERRLDALEKRPAKRAAQTGGRKGSKKPRK